MTNPTTPFGFLDIGIKDGISPNFGTFQGFIASSNTHQIFTGDALVETSGYFDVASVTGSTGAPVAGFAVGFSYQSISQKQTIFANYYPGSDAAGDVSVKVSNNPQALFQARANAGPITQAMVGKNVNFSLGSGGNTANGRSSFGIDVATTGTTSTLPLTIVGIAKAPQSDPTSADNIAFVSINQLAPSL